MCRPAAIGYSAGAGGGAWSIAALGNGLFRAASSSHDPTSRNSASQRATKFGLSGVIPVAMRVICGSMRG